MQSKAEADASAPALSFFEEIQTAEKMLAGAGEFTGERLFRDRPGIYAAIVRMTAEGLSISATARALGVSRNTVCAVREREGVSVEQEKKELLKDLRKASRIGVEKVLELLPETKLAKDAAIVSAVMIDKLQLLSGEATQRIERIELRPDQVKTFIDSLPVIEAELVEGEISNGIASGTPAQKGACPGSDAPALLDRISDVRSDDEALSNSVDAKTWATQRATHTNLTPTHGGGGGSSIGIPNTRGIDPQKQNFDQRADEPVETLCKRTPKKKQGPSKKGRISQKKKGGSGC